MEAMEVGAEVVDGLEEVAVEVEVVFCLEKRESMKEGRRGRGMAGTGKCELASIYLEQTVVGGCWEGDHHSDREWGRHRACCNRN